MSGKETEKNVVNISPDYASMATANSTVAILNAVIKQLFRGEGFSMRGLGKLSFNVFLLIILKKLLENTGDVLDKFSFSNLVIVKYCFQRLRYRHNTWKFEYLNDNWYIGDDNISIDCLCTKMSKQNIDITKNNSSFINNYGVYIRVVRDNNILTFTTVDNNMMRNYMYRLIDENRKITCDEEGKTTIYYLRFSSQWSAVYEPIEPAATLPVNNYIDLYHTLEERITGEEIFGKSNVPYCVNFDGPPGTGKTSFASYVSRKGLFNDIYIFNMVTDTHGLNLSEICKKIDEKVLPKENKLRILFIFDEIDKWLERYISNVVCKEQEESRKKTGSIRSANDKNDSSPVIVPDKMTQEDIEMFKNEKISEFVTHFHQLIDGHLFKSNRHQFVFIFNTNNFDETFVPIVGKTYQATLDRIQKYEFPLIGREQICSYIDEMVKRASGVQTSDQKIIKFIEKIKNNLHHIDNIKDNVKISYRELSRLLIQSAYNLEKTVLLINDVGSIRFEEDKANKKKRMADRFIN